MPTDPSTLEALGLSLVLDFITPEEEQTLLADLIVPGQRHHFEHAGGRSSIQRYGSRDAYANYIVSPVIPSRFVTLGERLVAQGLLTYQPDSVTVNEYLPGDAIHAHIDALKAGRVITVLSLGAPATMVFALKNTNTKHSVLLPRRSLVQMRDEIRYTWTHEILPVTATRYSVVFRCGQDMPE